jgi:hypothetical protein
VLGTTALDFSAVLDSGWYPTETELSMPFWEVQGMGVMPKLNRLPKRITKRRAKRAAASLGAIMSRAPRLMGSRQIVIRRTYEQTFSVNNGAVGTGAYISFNPQNLPNFSTDFGSVFELCRVIAADVSWQPTFSNFPFASGPTIAPQPMIGAYTTTVAAAPTTSSQVLQYGTAFNRQLMVPWRRRFNPVVGVNLTSGNQYDLTRNVWQSIGSGPQTNGLLIWVADCGVAAVTLCGRFYVTITFALSNPY